MIRHIKNTEKIKKIKESITDMLVTPSTIAPQTIFKHPFDNLNGFVVLQHQKSQGGDYYYIIVEPIANDILVYTGSVVSQELIRELKNYIDEFDKKLLQLFQKYNYTPLLLSGNSFKAI